MDITELRLELDKVDGKLIELLEKRMDLCKQIGDNDLDILVFLGDCVLDGDLVVAHLVLLLLESHLLEELLYAAVCDVLDHHGVEALGLLLADGLDDLACLCSLLGSEPALCGVGLDVVFAVHVGGVDADLLEGCVNGLLYHLVLGLLHCDGLLSIENALRAVCNADGDGVHGSDLHHDTLCEGLGDGLVESYESAELAGDLVVMTEEARLELGLE